jgi:hypothetical protein
LEERDNLALVYGHHSREYFGFAAVPSRFIQVG